MIKMQQQEKSNCRLKGSKSTTKQEYKFSHVCVQMSPQREIFKVIGGIASKALFS